nr:hypothetical protein [Streptomyces sp. MC1]
MLPKRWIIERLFAHLMRSRRLVRDVERRTATAEAMIYWSMTMIMTGLHLHPRRHHVHAEAGDHHLAGRRPLPEPGPVGSQWAPPRAASARSMWAGLDVTRPARTCWARSTLSARTTGPRTPPAEAVDGRDDWLPGLSDHLQRNTEVKRPTEQEVHDEKNRYPG